MYAFTCPLVYMCADARADTMPSHQGHNPGPSPEPALPGPGLSPGPAVFNATCTGPGQPADPGPRAGPILSSPRPANCHARA